MIGQVSVDFLASYLSLGKGPALRKRQFLLVYSKTLSSPESFNRKEASWVGLWLSKEETREKVGSCAGKDGVILQCCLLKCLSLSELCDFWIKLVPQQLGNLGGPLSDSIPVIGSSSQNGGKPASFSPFWRVGLLQHLPEAYAGFFVCLQHRGPGEDGGTLRLVLLPPT